MHDDGALIRELELLATLSQTQIRAALDDVAARAELVSSCLDEDVELRAEADHARDRGDDETACHHEQEASAWRATASALRGLPAVGSSASRRERRRSA
ncbi:hypothetical protein [Williamsia deligens]|uniref:TY-Chap C-terminal domain-containing protein n=1 Tax=Williamsia deligens TaxID=321325 RepID=A0ABW3G3M9_9NOCA|nr:hypothetical protein [Williamsia deligens]MCP2194596.1 hypothetical protein [Williamsia deligens]